MKTGSAAFGWLFACLLSLALVACGPSWVVVAAATPNPFVNQRSFAVEPVHFHGVRVGDKTEAEYQATKDPEQQASWSEDKRALAERLEQHLAEELPEVTLAQAPAPSPFLVRPRVTFIEPGFYAYVAAKPAEVQMTVEIFAANGAILDVVKLRSVVPATIANPSSGGRLRSAGEDLGSQLAAYLRSRIFP